MSFKSFDEFHGNAWGEHFKDPKGVAASFPQGLKLIEKPEQLSLLAKLMAHVLGEHLGLWEDGRASLRSLKGSPFFTEGSEAHAAIERYDRSLRYCEGDTSAAQGIPPADSARVLANAAASLGGQGQAIRAKSVFLDAEKIAASLEKSDPAQKDLAITFNNMALGLEFVEKRDLYETELMLLAAHAGRRHWEFAGTRLHVARAEYRLAMSHVQAGKGAEAVRHAELSMEISVALNSPPSELFFCQEAVAMAERCNKNPAGFAKARDRARDLFSKITDASEKKWCQDTMDKLNSFT